MKQNNIATRILTCLVTLSMLTLVFSFPVKTGGTVYSLHSLSQELTHTF